MVKEELHVFMSSTLVYNYLLIKLNFDLPDFCHYTIFTGTILVCYYFVAITYVVIMLHFTDL